MFESQRVLIVGSSAALSIENMYLRAFQDSGIETHFFPIITQEYKGFIDRAARKLLIRYEYAKIADEFLDYLKKRKNSFRWIFVFKGMQFPLKRLKQFRQAAGASQWININPDNPFNVASSGSSNKEVLKSLFFYDAYAMWSKKICNELVRAGCQKVIHIPFGYDAAMHFRATPLPDKDDARVLFIGTWDPCREEVLSRLSDFNLVIYGNGWEKIKKGSALKQKICGPAIYGVKACQEVANSLICLNLLRSQNEDAHNMRTFEIPAMGGMMLATRSQEQQDFFKEGVEAEYFCAIEELVSKIKYYSQYPDQALQIGEAGYQRARTSDYSYQDRVKQLGSLLT